MLVQQFGSSRNFQFVIQATIELDSAAFEAASLPKITEILDSDSSGLTKTYQTLVSQLSTQLADLETKAVNHMQRFESSLTEISALSNRIDAERTRLDALSAQFQKQFSEAESVRAKRFEELATAQSASSTELERKGLAAIEEVSKNAESTIKEAQEQFTGVSKDMRREFETQLTSLRTSKESEANEML